MCKYLTPPSLLLQVTLELVITYLTRNDRFDFLVVLRVYRLTMRILHTINLNTTYRSYRPT